MSIHEQDFHRDEKHHIDPAIIEWALPEEGIDIRLKLDNAGMEQLPLLCREKMAGLLSKIALLCEATVTNQEALQQNGVALEGVFIYLAEYTAGLIPLMEMLADADHEVAEDFPFQI
jgi:hypothetical protein